MSSATAQKRAAFSILAFLDESLSSGAVKADDVESIQVASASPAPRSLSGRGVSTADWN